MPSAAPLAAGVLLCLAMPSLSGCGNRGELQLVSDAELEAQVVDTTLSTAEPRRAVATPADTTGATPTGPDEPADGEGDGDGNGDGDDRDGTRGGAPRGAPAAPERR